MPGREARHGEVPAGRAHRIALTVSDDGADLIEVPIKEQHRPRPPAAVVRLARVGDGRLVVQVPRTRMAEAARLERFR